MDAQTAAAYLRRIGVTDPVPSDVQGLRVLHRAHQMTVPFENLSIHLAEQISLAEDDLVAKVVTARRGGFCYELNGLFALLLEALGAKVTRVAARVYGDGLLGRRLITWRCWCARPTAAGHGWPTSDSAVTPSTRCGLTSAREQDDPAGSFRLADADDGDIDVLRDGTAQYRIEARARSLADFAATCWWQQTSPASHFTQGTICSRLTEDGRISVGGRTLIVTSNGVRSEQELADDDALLAAYREHFGVVLSRAPKVP